MTLKQNITSILECHFSGFKNELIEACAQRIMEQIERQADTPQTDRMTEEEIDTMLAKVLVGQTVWEKEKPEKSLCNSCVKECDDRKRNLFTIECNKYKPKQTDCSWK